MNGKSCLSRFLTLFLSPFKIRLSGASFFSQQAQCKPPLNISSPRATNHTRRHFWAPRYGQMTLTLKWLIENQVPIRSIWGLKVLSCLLYWTGPNWTLTPTHAEGLRKNHRAWNRFRAKMYRWIDCIFLVIILKFILALNESKQGENSL